MTNFVELDLVPFMTTESPVVKDSLTGLDFFRDPTDQQVYLRRTGPAGDEFSRQTDPATGLYLFSALDLTTGQFIPLLYSTTADPTAGTLLAADQTTNIDPTTVSTFESQLLPVTDTAITSRLTDEEFTYDVPVSSFGAESPSLSRSLALFNGEHVRGAVDVAAQSLLRIHGDAAGPAHIERLFLCLLSRRPTAEELDAMLDLAGEDIPQRGLEDATWVILNSAEFQTNH